MRKPCEGCGVEVVEIKGVVFNYGERRHVCESEIRELKLQIKAYRRALQWISYVPLAPSERFPVVDEMKKAAREALQDPEKRKQEYDSKPIPCDDENQII